MAGAFSCLHLYGLSIGSQIGSSFNPVAWLLVKDGAANEGETSVQASGIGLFKKNLVSRALANMEALLGKSATEPG